MPEENEPIEAEETRPEWLPENFKSPEDLAASYAEAQRKIAELGTQASRVEELTAKAQRADEWEAWYAEQQQQQRQAQADPHERIRETWEDPDRQPELVFAILQRQAEMEQRIEQMGKQGPDPAVTEIKAAEAERLVRANNPDYEEHLDSIKEIVQASPALVQMTESGTPSQIASGLQIALDAARGRSLASTQGQAAAQAAEAARIQLEQAQTMTGGSARPATQSESEEYWARVRAAESGGYGV